MVHSMTAFARSEQAGAHGTLSWEIRSVNHRYLEPHLRLPEAFRDLEGQVRDALRKGLSRGKVECTLRFAEEGQRGNLQVDQERASQLIAAAESVAALIRQPAAIDPLQVLGWPGVLVGDALDPQALNQSALELFHKALEQLKEGRRREGESWPSYSANAWTASSRKSPRCVSKCHRCSPPRGRRFSTVSARCVPSWIRSASSRKWFCWRRRAMSPRNSIA